MSGFLTDAVARESQASGPALRELQRAEISGKVLAVCERGSTLVLAREREVGKVGADGKRSRENGTEKVLKPTSALADFQHAIEAGLL